MWNIEQKTETKKGQNHDSISLLNYTVKLLTTEVTHGLNGRSDTTEFIT